MTVLKTSTVVSCVIVTSPKPLKSGIPSNERSEFTLCEELKATPDWAVLNRADLSGVPVKPPESDDSEREIDPEGEDDPEEKDDPEELDDELDPKARASAAEIKPDLTASVLAEPSDEDP